MYDAEMLFLHKIHIYVIVTVASCLVASLLLLSAPLLLLFYYSASSSHLLFHIIFRFYSSWHYSPAVLRRV